MKEFMTEGEFNELCKLWADKIRSLASTTLAKETHSSLKLAMRLNRFVDSDKKTHVAYKIKFHFDRYGVFRAYGAGRGYKIIEGRITLNRHPSEKYAKRNPLDGKIKRNALDWIDGHIEKNIQELAETVQDYYGDNALRTVLSEIDKMKIKKR